MNSFMHSPLEVPVVPHSMKGLENFLQKYNYQIGPLYADDRVINSEDCDKLTNLYGIEKPLQLKLLTDNGFLTLTRRTNHRVSTEDVRHILSNLSLYADKNFTLLAEALVASLELSFGEVSLVDKPIYTSLILKATERLISEYGDSDEIDLCESDLFVSENELDFLLTVTRILKEITNVKKVNVICTSSKLMLPLFILTEFMNSVSSSFHIVSFIPIESIQTPKASLSSVQLILPPVDLDSAVRSVISAASYHMGTTSWRPSVILIQQSMEVAFRQKVCTLILNDKGTGDYEILNENPHPSSKCRIPSYVKKNFEDLLNLALSDGGEIIRPSIEKGPVFIFGLSPASKLEDMYKDFPVGPFSIVLPFRTANEGIKLAKYFGDRESRILGSGSFVYAIPKSLTVWNENFSLTHQILAKLPTYDTFGVNSDLQRLCKSYFSVEFNRREFLLPAFVYPYKNSVEKEPVNCIAPDIYKYISAAKDVVPKVSKICLRKLLESLKLLKCCSSFGEEIQGIFDAYYSSPEDSNSRSYSEEVQTAYSERQLLHLHRCRNHIGPFIVLLNCSSPNIKLMRLIIFSILFGNIILLLVPSDVTIDPEVEEFCNAINQIQFNGGVHSAGNSQFIQLKRTSGKLDDLMSSIAKVSLLGVSCVLSDNKDGAIPIDSSYLRRYASIFVSVGGDLFAN